MEPAIREYEIQLRQISSSWRKKVGLFFLVGCFMFACRWITESFSHDTHQPILEALIMPVALGVGFAFRPFSRWLPASSIRVIIGDDFIEMRMRSAFLRHKKHIRREQIKSISEGRRGLRVMHRGKFGSIIPDFILVPAPMPEYQEIRSILSGWAPIQAQR
ncbi:MAG: hypothetical protein WCG81_19975 [Candidatus Angelobacter sp.]